MKMFFSRIHLLIFVFLAQLGLSDCEQCANEFVANQLCGCLDETHEGGCESMPYSCMQHDCFLNADNVEAIIEACNPDNSSKREDQVGFGAEVQVGENVADTWVKELIKEGCTRAALLNPSTGEELNTKTADAINFKPGDTDTFIRAFTHHDDHLLEYGVTFEGRGNGMYTMKKGHAGAFANFQNSKGSAVSAYGRYDAIALCLKTHSTWDQTWDILVKVMPRISAANVRFANIEQSVGSGDICEGKDCGECLDVVDDGDYACAFYDGKCILSESMKNPADYKASKFVWSSGNCPVPAVANVGAEVQVGENVADAWVKELVKEGCTRAAFLNPSTGEQLNTKTADAINLNPGDTNTFIRAFTWVNDNLLNEGVTFEGRSNGIYRMKKGHAGAFANFENSKGSAVSAYKRDDAIALCLKTHSTYDQTWDILVKVMPRMSAANVRFANIEQSVESDAASKQELESTSNAFAESSLLQTSKLPDIVIYIFAAIGFMSILYVGAKNASKTYSRADYAEV